MPDQIKMRIQRALRDVRVVTPPVPKDTSSEQQNPSGFSCLETIKEEARVQGYEQAKQEFMTRFSQMLMVLENEVKQMADTREEYYASLAENAMEIGMAVAEKFLISEREKRNYSITAIVNSVIEKMESKGGRLTIAVNPEDLEALGDGSGLNIDEATPSVKVMGDPSVPMAGCRLDRGLGQASFSLEEQMEQIRSMLAELEPVEETIDEKGNILESGTVQTEPH